MTGDVPGARQPGQPLSDNSAPRRSKRWMLCFSIGFAVVFVAFLLFRTMSTWHPAGRGLIRVTLWRYYLIELKRAFAGGLFEVRELGPASGSGSSALIVFVVHLAISSIGGVVAIGLGLLARRLRRSPSTGASLRLQPRPREADVVSESRMRTR